MMRADGQGDESVVVGHSAVPNRVHRVQCGTSALEYAGTHAVIRQLQRTGDTARLATLERSWCRQCSMMDATKTTTMWLTSTMSSHTR